LLVVVVVDGGLMAEPTKEKVLLALEPRVVMAAMHTTMIRASMTAYSTAVGPSSFVRKSTTDVANFDNMPLLRFQKSLSPAGSWACLARAPRRTTAVVTQTVGHVRGRGK